MSKPLPITVIILTYNEEIHLDRCLKNVVEWVDEVIVVDSYSDDKTVEIAEKHGARVYQHEFENQAKQFNWAIDNIEIKNEWIFRLDADEYLTEELKNEIKENIKDVPDEVSGFMMKRRVVFMGRWIKHGGYYPTWFLRLYRKGKGRYEDREMDEHLIVEGKIEKLNNDFVDENLKGLEEWIARHNNYSTREARERMKNQTSNTEHQTSNLAGQAGMKRRAKEWYLHLPLLWRSLAYCTYRYVFRLGFLDGKEGLIFHFLQGGWHQFLIDAKVYEQTKKSQKHTS